MVYGSPNDGKLGLPIASAVDSSGNIYVVEYGNNRIQKFDASGNFLAKWGSQGSGDGQFNEPVGIALDSSNNVYVTDMGNHRIQKFDSSGNFLAKWGSQGSDNGQFNGPAFIALDSSGNIYVTEPENNRIQKFDSSGNFLAKWGSMGSGEGQFVYPYGISISQTGNIYVADMYNSRIQAFAYPSDPPTQPSTDLNGDGAADTIQPHVAGMVSSPVTGKSVALELSPACTLVNSDVVKSSSLATKDPAYSYTEGLWNFEANCGTPGYTTTVKLYYYDITPDNKLLRKYNPNTNAFFNISNANITTQTINNHNVTVVTYQVTDGGPLDTDNQANGTIVDPAGLAEAVVGVPNTGL